MNKYDNWRKKYSTMTYEDHVEYTAGFKDNGLNDGSDCRYFEMDQHLINYFKLQPELLQGAKIIEFGGWRGHLSDSIMGKFTVIKSWVNYEIAIYSIIHSVNKRSNYICAILNKNFWELLPEQLECDYFIASHSFEHITSNQIRDIMYQLQQTGVKMLFIDVPIDNDNPTNWDQYNGTHILEIGFKSLIELIESYGFVLDTREGNYAQFKRK